MNKKGLSQQVFVYVLLIIVVGAVLIYGYNAIRSISESQEDVVLLQFKQKLKNDISSIASQYGTISVFNYDLPEFNKVCFIDLGVKDCKDIDQGCTLSSNPITDDSWNDRSNDNMFLFGSKLDIDRIDKLGLEGNKRSECFDFQNGLLTLKIEGAGDRAVVS